MKKELVMLMAGCLILTGCQNNLSGLDTTGTSTETPAGNTETASETPAADASGDDTAATTSDASVDYKVYDDYINELSSTFSDASIDGFSFAERFAGEFSSRFAPGYTRMDIDGDGVEELIIGENNYIEGTTVPEGRGHDSDIVEVYTIKDNQMVPIIEFDASAANYKQYYFTNDNVIVCNEPNLETPTVDVYSPVVQTYYKLKDGKLEMFDSVREEWIEDNDGNVETKWYTSATDPYKDKSKEISAEEGQAIIDKYACNIVEFEKFVKGPASDKHFDLYTRVYKENILGYDHSFTFYIKLFDDNTGELCTDDISKFTHDDKTFKTETDTIDYELDGNTLKVKTDFGVDEYTKAN